MSEKSESSGYTKEEMNLVEAVIFSSPKPVPLPDLKKLLSSRHKGGVRGIIDQLNQKYEENSRSFRLREIAGGFQFYILPEFSMQVEKYFSRQKTRKLSPAGLETLAIIAYKQPITRGELENIRGVNSDGVISTLLERGLIKPAGRAERIGKPLLYATTSSFLEYFGINDLNQLPSLEELAIHKENFAGREKGLQLQLEDNESENNTEV